MDYLARLVEWRGTYRDWFAISEGKNLLRKPKRRWEDITKVDLQYFGRGLDWTVLSQDRDRWLLLML